MKQKYDYEDKIIGYALKKDMLKLGFDVYKRSYFVYERVGYITAKNKKNAINILEEIFYDKHSKNQS